MQVFWSTFRRIFRKYGMVAVLGWQDSLVYRFNALVWVLYAVAPSLTLMLVWLAAYSGPGKRTAEIGGFSLPEMMTYYLCVTLLSVAITPHPEWEIATTIRDGKITPFIVRPVSYFWYRFAWESSYQVVKTAMALPAFALLAWLFRDYIELPAWHSERITLFLLASLGAYVLLSQLKFLLGISAFWIAEPGGFMEIWNVLNGLFAGRLLPVALLPGWAAMIGAVLPFSILYSFPLQILFGRASTEELVSGFVRQGIWIFLLTLLVSWSWRRGLRAYEAYGG